VATPLDNIGSLTARPTVDANVVRPEAVVEFGRKKAPAPATDSTEDRTSFPDRAGATRDVFALPMARVQLPKDSSKPLVTANERYAREAMEAYKSLRTRMLKSQATQGFRSIAITSVGRADGKTLTAFNLAYCCARVENLSVLLIDGDLQSRSLTKLIGGLPSIGLADVIGGTASYEDAIVRTDAPNLYVMGAGTGDLHSTDMFSTEKWSQVVRWSRSHFKIILIDALSMGANADFELMAPECDGILLVVRARSTSREALKTAVEQLDPGKLVGVVWNGAN
jgi:capsular exopolysaccharide synthesis family protein